MELDKVFAASIAGGASKRPASAAGRVNRQFDEVLKGDDAKDCFLSITLLNSRQFGSTFISSLP